jgi:N-acyl-D-amino-acid deacylase
MNFDIAIRNASVIIGDGSPAIAADVGIKNGRIVALGSAHGSARREIDASGLTLSPGFVDVHTHDDRAVLVNPGMTMKTSQGVTTVVAGNCGISAAPVPRGPTPEPPLTLLSADNIGFFADFEAHHTAIRATRPAVNIMTLAGHTSLRVAVMDKTDRPATQGEIAAMQALLREALEAGVSGLSTGLFYPPASEAPSAEIEALLAIVGEWGGVQTAHLRDESAGLLASLDEAIASARSAGSALVISHLKCGGPRVWGQAKQILARVERAMAEQDIAFDMYPYAASSTMLRADKLDDSKSVLVSWSTPHPEVSGIDLADVARDWCCSPADAVRRLSPAGGIYFRMEERDVRLIVSHPFAMIGSDGLPHDKHPHPRLWGTFPRVLGHYVRDQKLMSLEMAIHRMTGLPARVFGLGERGLIGEGMIADLVLFDPDEVIDRATFTTPMQHSAGIQHVMVAGEMVFEGGADTGARPGQILTRTGMRAGR